MIALFLLAALLVTPPFSGQALAAQDQTPLARLDRPYRHLHRTWDDTRHPDLMMRLRGFFESELPSVSAVETITDVLGPIRDQDQRGQCSVFSATALAEWMLADVLGGGKPLDLSEQWLSYTVTVNNGDEGSEAYLNSRVLRKYGITEERFLPYEGAAWEELSPDKDPLVAERCGSLRGKDLKLCQFGHYSPEWLFAEPEQVSPDFARARDAAFQVRDRFLRGLSDRTAVTRVSDVKRLLADGVPVLLEFDFYHGAWNSSDMKKMGLGDDDVAAYERGEVGFPEVDSLDRTRSLRGKFAAGHSILIVGYDDDEVITTRQKMNDGSVREFSYKGVYYFRNSWGDTTWGKNTEIQGRRMPGYGKITQKYAHQLASFFSFSVE